MATVTRENIGTLHDKITVKLTKEDYMPSFDKAVKDYSKKAAIPGFRKGMVPVGLLRKMVGQQTLVDEVMNVTGKTLQEFMKRENISVIGQPLYTGPEGVPPVDINKPGDVEMPFEVGVKPVFEIPAFTNHAHVNQYKIVVSDAILDEEMAHLKSRFGKEDEQVEITGDDNIVYYAADICDAAGEILAGTEPYSDRVEVKKLPVQVRAMIMGKHPGDSVVIRPADVCTEEELNGFLELLSKTAGDAQGYYRLGLEKVTYMVAPDMNEEFFNRVFPQETFAGEEQFRERLKKQLEFEFHRLTGERLENEIFEMLVHTTPISLPGDFLKRWLIHGADPEKPKTEEQAEKEYPSFEHQLRWQLICDKIMLENKINVTKGEVNRNIKAQVMQHFGIDAEDEEDSSWLDNYTQEVLKDTKATDKLYQDMLTAKVFGAIQSRLSIQETEISNLDFFKLPAPHGTHA